MAKVSGFFYAQMSPSRIAATIASAAPAPIHPAMFMVDPPGRRLRSMDDMPKESERFSETPSFASIADRPGIHISLTIPI